MRASGFVSQRELCNLAESEGREEIYLRDGFKNLNNFFLIFFLISSLNNFISAKRSNQCFIVYSLYYKNREIQILHYLN